MASSDYPTVLAAHREMQSWQTLLLEPSAMRAPSLYQDARVIDPRGGNLPGTISRLQKSESRQGTTCSELANRLSELIEDVQELLVRDDPKTETLTLEVKGRDGVFHPARSLSDGTLRFLVLATLVQDPSVRGVICLEEPENGIHPERIPAMVRLLKDIAVKAQYTIDANNPLRQVIVNTHSPEVFKHVTPAEDLVYLDEEKRTVDGVTGRIATASTLPRSWRANDKRPERPITPGKIWAYLGSEMWSEDMQILFDFVGSQPES
jgi:predicted ATPase